MLIFLNLDFTINLHTMDSIGKITEEIINRSPFLRESMTDGLINVSALARKIHPEIEEITGKEVKEGAIVMAIKRMTPGLYHKLNVRIKNVLGELGDVIIRSNLISFTYLNSDSSAESHSQVVKIIAGETDGFFALCKGNSETTFVTTEKYKALVEQVFANERLVNKIQNVSTITIKLPEVNADIQGIYYYILKQLAWQGINIIELMSSSNEFTIIVDERDVNNAFMILNQMKRDNHQA